MEATEVVDDIASERKQTAADVPDGKLQIQLMLSEEATA
jgi:hypothetical protein